MDSFERTRYERLVLTIQGIQLEMQRGERDRGSMADSLEALEEQANKIKSDLIDCNVYLTRLNIAMVALQTEASSIPETER